MARDCVLCTAVERGAGVKATALMTDEIGGSNAMEPMVTGALAGLPVVDVDAMGRAFPEAQMNTFLHIWREAGSGGVDGRERQHGFVS